MDQSFDIADSTDWLDTPLSIVAPLESALRCQVCKDFFDNPVITSCCHTFCSLCIRRCLSSEGKCPACRSPDQELKLRRNWAVQELVDSFKNARPAILSQAIQSASVEPIEADGDVEKPATKKRRLNAPNGTDSAPPEGRRTRSHGVMVEVQIENPEIEVIEDSADDEFVPDDGLVACPMCNRRMKNETVFSHLDICKGPQRPAEAILRRGPSPIGFRGSRSQQQETAKPPERLPVINYSLLKEGVFRKKLRDLGIADWGPRPLLQRRHTEWMNLWNANCDARIPKSKRELLRELDIWERTQGGMAPIPPPASSLGGAHAVMRKDFDSAAWSASHDDDFKQLIQNARKKTEAQVRPTIPDRPEKQPADETNLHSENRLPNFSTERSSQIDKLSELSEVPAVERGSQATGHSEQESSQKAIFDAPLASA